MTDRLCIVPVWNGKNDMNWGMSILKNFTALINIHILGYDKVERVIFNAVSINLLYL